MKWKNTLVISSLTTQEGSSGNLDKIRLGSRSPGHVVSLSKRYEARGIHSTCWRDLVYVPSYRRHAVWAVLRKVRRRMRKVRRCHALEYQHMRYTVRVRLR